MIMRLEHPQSCLAQQIKSQKHMNNKLLFFCALVLTYSVEFRGGVDRGAGGQKIACESVNLTVHTQKKAFDAKNEQFLKNTCYNHFNRIKRRQCRQRFDYKTKRCRLGRQEKNRKETGGQTKSIIVTN